MKRILPLIYRTGGRYIRGISTVVGAAINNMNDEADCEVTGGIIEMKRVSMIDETKTSSEVVQTMANLVKVAGFLAEKGLEKGTITEQITVYDIQMSYSSSFCVPFK